MVILQHFDEVFLRRLRNQRQAGLQRVFQGSKVIVWGNFLQTNNGLFKDVSEYLHAAIRYNINVNHACIRNST